MHAINFHFCFVTLTSQVWRLFTCRMDKGWHTPDYNFDRWEYYKRDVVPLLNQVSSQHHLLGDVRLLIAIRTTLTPEILAEQSDVHVNKDHVKNAYACARVIRVQACMRPIFSNHARL